MEGPAPDDRAATLLQGMRRDAFDRERPAWASSIERLGSVRAGLARIDLRIAFAVGVAIIVLAVVVAASLIASRSGAPKGPTVTVPAAMSTATTAGASSSSTTIGTGVVVQASGAVRSPGVYRLPVGSRVVDLLERAGGPAIDLDLDRVNLAAVLVDGSRVWLPRVGESAPVVDGAAGNGSAAVNGPVDINHATTEQLDALPGIGPATAAAIIAEREKRGRFRSVDDLARVKAMTRSRIDALRDRVVAG